MKEIWVCARETGDKIEKVNSLQDGQELIERFEIDDKKQGVYEQDFYEVIEYGHD